MSWKVWYTCGTFWKLRSIEASLAEYRAFCASLDRTRKPFWQKFLHVPSFVDHVKFSSVDMHKAQNALYACCCSTLQQMLHHKCKTLQCTATHCNVHMTDTRSILRSMRYSFAQAILSTCMTPSTVSKIDRRNLFENKNIRNTTWNLAVLSKWRHLPYL